MYPPRGGGTPYNGVYGEAPPEGGTFLRLQVYKRVGKSVVSQREVNNTCRLLSISSDNA